MIKSVFNQKAKPSVFSLLCLVNKGSRSKKSHFVTNLCHRDILINKKRNRIQMGKW